MGAEESKIGQKMPLEELFSRLEEVIETMEKEELSLEQSFHLYNEGMELLKECGQTIDAVEKKVLALDKDGETYEFQ